MTKKEMLKKLESMDTENKTIDVDEWNDEIEITFIDFLGFNDEWAEIDNDEFDYEVSKAIYELLDSTAKETHGDMYKYYIYDGFTVCVGYSSFDI